MTPSKGEHFANLTFHGATGEVTGANFLLEIDGKKILVDCGMHQGTKLEEDKNFSAFAYNPKEMEFLFVTHAHQDHIGKIPKLVRDGFRGVIYSTEPTREISKLMFQDALGLIEDDAKDRNVDPLYDQNDIDQAIKLWKIIPYHDPVVITDDLKAIAYDAGHVLGSTMWEFNFKGKRMLFTGDLGNTPTTLLKDTEVFEEPQFLLMESVYGDRNHEQEDRREHLCRVVNDSIAEKGTLMIPSFSLERTQEILFDLDQLVRNNRVPQVPTYLDSPLATSITELYKKFPDYLNKEARGLAQKGDPLFDFPGLTIIETRDESKALNIAPDPKIIIAGSGMMNGGRIVHHAEHHLPDPNATLLLVGYQAQGTLGSTIQQGAKTVRIHDHEIPVRARIETISGYSGHKGADQLVEFVDSIKKNIEIVFCCMGEERSQETLAEHLRDKVGVHAVVPKEGETTELFF